MAAKLAAPVGFYQVSQEEIKALVKQYRRMWLDVPNTELAKQDAAVYEAVLPQLKQIRENAIYLHQSGSSKVRNSQAHAKNAGVKLATLPPKVKRTKEDDINQSGRKKRK